MKPTLTIFTSNSSRTVLDALLPAFERESGYRVTVVADSAKTMLARVRMGETADVAILLEAAIDELVGSGIIAATSRRLFASSRIGLAVRAGAPRPDIGTVDAFRQALLDAKSVAHTVHGASGMHVPLLLERLGIAEALRSKTVTRPGGYIATVVAAGEAELAIQQIVELLAVPGVDLVGPLPEALQKVFMTAAGIFAASPHPAEAAALLRFLVMPGHAAVFREKGLEPVTA